MYNLRVMRLSKRADIWAVGAITTAVIIFFWPVVTGQAWIPRGGGDLVSFLYPMYRFAARSLWNGEIPLWNPYLYAGAPFVSDNQSGLFYPVNLALFLLNPNFSYRTLQWLVLFHFWLAGVGMYVCLRGWRTMDRIRPLPALLAALTFMFSGVFITHIGNLNLNAVIAWLPLTLLALHRAIEAETGRKRLRWTVGGGLLVSVSTLAGHGQMTFMLGMFLGTYGIYRAATERNGRPLLILLLVGVIGAAGASVSLLPTLAQIQHTPRAGFDFAQSTNYSLPLKALVGLFAPNFYGRGIGNYWGDWPRVEYGYAGVVPWLLAAIPFFAKRRRQTLFFGAAGAFFLALALGGNSPLYALLFERLPIVPFQVPARFVILADFCLAWLAGVGLDVLCKTELVKRRRLLLAGTAVFLIALAVYLFIQLNQLGIARPDRMAQMRTAVYTFIILAIGGWGLLAASQRGWLRGRGLAVTAVLLLAIDVIGLGWRVEIEPGDPNPGFAAASPALEFLLADSGLHRIDIATTEWQSSLPQLAGLYSIGGVYNPLQLSDYAAYNGSLGYRGSPVYNLLGVKYVVGNKKNPPGDTNFLVPVFEEDPRVNIYLNLLALPRVLIVQNAIVVPDHDAAFAAIHADDFDPAQTVILEAGEPLAQEPKPIELTVLRYDLNWAAFSATVQQPAYLLLPDMYHSDWRATIDGEPAPILRADYALRAVYLEPGTHEVSFKFVPLGWRLGVGITAVTWLTALGLLVKRKM